MRIAGVDASVRSFGYCAPGSGVCATIRPRAGADDPARRLHELAEVIERLLRGDDPDLVVIEGYSLNSPGRIALVRLGEIGGIVRLRLFELGIAYVEIPPASLKRYATGAGNAQKPAMIAAAHALARHPVANDDEADAFLLRHLGRAAYGLEAIELDHRREIVDSVSWPDVKGE